MEHYCSLEEYKSGESEKLKWIAAHFIAGLAMTDKRGSFLTIGKLKTTRHFLNIRYVHILENRKYKNEVLKVQEER
jgi:signal transduction histidine kinase